MAGWTNITYVGFDGSTVGQAHWPPQPGDMLDSWSYRIQPYLAIAERVVPIQNNFNFPPFETVWTDGTITSVTDNNDGTLNVLFTATDAGVWDDRCVGSGPSRFVGYVCTACTLGYIPSTYQIVIVVDPNDPLAVVRATITAETYTGPVPAPVNFTISDHSIKDAITANFITSLSDLTGSTYYLQTNNALYKTDRIPPKPNDVTYWRGSDSIGDANIALSVLGADADTGESSLLYTWSVTGPAPVRLSINGTNVAKNTLAALQSVGTYAFTVMITDPGGLSCYSVVEVVVSAAGLGISISTSSPTAPSPDDDADTNHAPTVATPAAADHSDGLMSWTDDPEGETYGTIVDDSIADPVLGPFPTIPGWSIDKWATNFDLLIYGSDGYLHRVTPQHNEANRIYFTSSNVPDDVTLGGQYIILKLGGKGMPGRSSSVWNQFYYGVSNSAATHLPDDTIGATPVPAVTTTVSDGDPCSIGGMCSDSTISTLDVLPAGGDVQVAVDNLCDDRRGTFLAPNYWFSDRSLLKKLQEICIYYIPPGPYASEPFAFTIAEYFLALGEDGGSTTLNYDSGTSTYSFTATGFPASHIYWTVKNADGSELSSGDGTTDGSGVITSVSATHPDDDGKTVVFSPGWQRYEPRMVGAIQDVSVMIVDTKLVGTDLVPVDPIEIDIAVDGMGIPVIPPIYDCNGAGGYVMRPASVNYTIFVNGVKTDSGVPFVDGDLAIYLGDNPGDPTINPQTLITQSYYDRFYRGTPNSMNLAARVASRSGIVTSGTPTSFRDTSKHWLTDYQNSGAFSRGDSPAVESGTATNLLSDSTTLEDSTKDTTNGLLQSKCWWDGRRFNGTANNVSDATQRPFANFVLEVDHAFSGTDLVVDATDATKVTSTGHLFTPADCGGVFTLSGTGWTAGTYTIGSVSADGAAFLDSSPAPVGTTGGVWALAVTIKRMINSTTNGAGGITITVDALDGFLISGGDVYRIYEPQYKLNKWRGLRVQMTRLDKTGYRVTILVNDDNECFVDNSTAFETGDTTTDPTPYTAKSGWTYNIIEWLPGVIIRWNDGAHDDPDAELSGVPRWEDPGGDDDTRRIGTQTLSEKFILGIKGEPSRFNLPTYIKRYGLPEPYDAIGTVLRQLYDGINILQLWKKSMTWINQSEAGGAFLANTISAAGSDPNQGAYTYAKQLSVFNSAFTDPGTNYSAPPPDGNGDIAEYEVSGAGTESNSAPRSLARAIYWTPGAIPDTSDTFGLYQIDASGTQAYGLVSGISTAIDSSVEMYAIADLNNGGLIQNLVSYMQISTGISTSVPSPASFTGPGGLSGVPGLWDSGPVSNEAVRYSSAPLGPSPTDVPAIPFVDSSAIPGQYPPSQGGDYNGSAGTFSGYFVHAAFAAVRWDFSFHA